MSEISEKEVFAAAAVLLGRVNAPEQAIYSAARAALEAAAHAAPQPSGPVKALEDAARNLLDRMFSTYRARNGREVGVEADDGEKCWIVHSDDIDALRFALTAGKPEQAVPSGYSEEAMLTLAREAVRRGITRSSFSQCAEWAHDEATDETAAPTAGGGDAE